MATAKQRSAARKNVKKAASAAKRTASAANSKPMVVPGARTETARVAPAPPTAQPSVPRPVVSAPAVAAGPNPADACKGRILFSKEMCLAENCVKPAAHNHPLCVEWREQVKMRQ